MALKLVQRVTSWQTLLTNRSIYIMSTSINATAETKAKTNGSYHGNLRSDNGAKVDFLIDLRSDTVTKPSKAMLEKMMTAEVGDDVMGEDPTVRELESRMAKRLGKQAGLFVTSGSMGNLISVLVHCTNRGAEAIVGDNAHMFLYEQGSMAQFGGVQANTIPNEADGTYSIAQVVKNIRPDDCHFAKTSLICIENTHNMCGGRVIPLKWLDELTKVAREHEIPVHMDGARLFNASVASGIPADRIVRDVDSVSICLSKSLGAPVGSVLVGSEDFIAKARRTRKALGGGMRQAGILASAGIYCLDHMIERLAEDNANAKIIAKAIYSVGSPVVSIDFGIVETNILMLNLKGLIAGDVCRRFAEVTPEEEKKLGNSISVLSSPRCSNQIRLVLHCDVSRQMAEKVAEKIVYVIKELSG